MTKVPRIGRSDKLREAENSRIEKHPTWSSGATVKVEWSCNEVLGIPGLSALPAHTMRIVFPSQPSADGATALPKMVTPSLAALCAYAIRGMFATFTSARRAGAMRMMGTARFISCLHKTSGPPFSMRTNHRKVLAASTFPVA